jgi:hypothetical protein
MFCFLLEYKKARQEIKKKSSDTLKLQKKAKKGNFRNPTSGRITLRESKHVLGVSVKQKVFTSQTSSHRTALGNGQPSRLYLN